MDIDESSLSRDTTTTTTTTTTTSAVIRHKNEGDYENNTNNEQDESESTLALFLQAAEESKGSNLGTIRSIVFKVLSEPRLFSGYDQIRAILLPNSHDKNNTVESEKLARSLDLFSYGTLRDYRQQPTLYLEFNDSQLTKLKQLSVLTVIQQQQQQVSSFHRFPQNDPPNSGVVATIPYEQFYPVALDPAEWNPRAVEDLLISCLYMGVLDGKLCQRTRSFHWQPSPGRYRSRDVLLDSIPALTWQLQLFQNNLTSTFEKLEHDKQVLLESCEKDLSLWQQAEDRLKKNEANYLLRWSSGSAGHPPEAGGAAGAAGAGHDFPPGDYGGSSRRQKRGRNDPASLFARFHA